MDQDVLWSIRMQEGRTSHRNIVRHPGQQGRETYAIKYIDTTTLFYVTHLLSWRSELKVNRGKNQKQHSTEQG